jgi:AraC-like DNA-binding protein
VKRIDHIEKEATYRGLFFLDYYDKDFLVYEGPHRHNFSEILWITKGKGIQNIDGTKFPLSSNDLFLIPEGQVHNISKAANISGYLLCFKEDFWQYAPAGVRNFKSSLFNNLLINSYFHPQKADAREITSVMESMLYEFGKPEYGGKTELLAAYTKVLLIKINNLKTSTHAAVKAHSKEYHLFEQAIDLIEKDYRTSHEVAYYAGKMGVQNRKLTYICQLFSGKGAKELIDQRIMSESKRFLQFSNLSVKEIAGRLNYSDQYQFSKFFKKHAGVSPVAYREQATEIDI